MTLNNSFTQFVRQNFFKLAGIIAISFSGWVYGLYKDSVINDTIEKATQVFMTKGEHVKVVEEEKQLIRKEFSEAFVDKTLYNSQTEQIDKRLTRIESQLDRILERLPR